MQGNEASRIIKENKICRIEQGEIFSDITGVPEGESLVIRFENRECAIIPANQVEFLELSGVYSTYLTFKANGERDKFVWCRKTVLVLKEGANIAGKACGMRGDYTVFERVNTLYPDISSIGFTRNGVLVDETDEFDIGVPWPREGSFSDEEWCNDEANHTQRSWVKDGKLYLYIEEGFNYPDVDYPDIFCHVHHEWRGKNREKLVGAGQGHALAKATADPNEEWVRAYTEAFGYGPSFF